MVKSYSRYELGSSFGVIASGPSICSVNGSLAVCAGESILLWELKTGGLLGKLRDDPKTAVTALSSHEESGLLAAGYSNGSIRIWDLQTQTAVMVLHGHRSAVSGLAFCEDGTQLASGGQDTNIVVWDLVSEIGVMRLKGHRGPITGLLYLGSGTTRMVSTSRDGIIKLWDLETRYAIDSHVAHKGECWALVCRGNSLVTAANIPELRLWEVSDDKLLMGAVMERPSSRHRPSSLVFSEDGSSLYCSCGDAVYKWRARTADEVRRLQKRRQRKDVLPLAAEPTPVRVRAKISGLAVGPADHWYCALSCNSIEAWEGEERRVAIEIPGHRTDVRDMCLSGDDRLLATGANGSLKIWNTRSQQCIRTFEETGYLLAVRFLPGDGLVVTGSKEGALEIWDLAAAQKHNSVVDAHPGGVWSLDLSADGTTLVSGGADKTVKFWNIELTEDEVPGRPGITVKKLSLKLSKRIEFNDDVLAVKMSPDGRLVAASLLDNTVKVYYADTLKFFLNLYGHQLPALSIDISHDSKTLISASADKNIKIWGLDFGDCHRSLFAHDDSILKVMFEPQTANFFSCSKDGLVKYWDSRKFVQLQKLQAHQSEVWALTVANDASFVVSAGHDKTIRKWDFSDEPLFVEEEREQELEEHHEERLVDEMEEPQVQDENDEEEIVEAPVKHSLDSLKAGERLYEALEICYVDWTEKPRQRHAILTALNIPPEQYLLDVLSRIKTPLVEDALLTFPLDKIVNLLRFVKVWLEQNQNISLITRVLMFCLRTFHRQLVANKMLIPEIDALKSLLRHRLAADADLVGYNVAQLKMLEEQWVFEHVASFVEQPDPSNNEKKRVFASVA